MQLSNQLRPLEDKFYTNLPLRTLSTCMKIAKKESLNLIDRLIRVSLPIHIDVYNKKPIGLKKWIVLNLCNSIARIMYLFTKTVTPIEVRNAFKPVASKPVPAFRSKSAEAPQIPEGPNLAAVSRSKSEDLKTHNVQPVKDPLVEKESSFESDNDMEESSSGSEDVGISPAANSTLLPNPPLVATETEEGKSQETNSIAEAAPVTEDKRKIPSLVTSDSIESGEDTEELSHVSEEIEDLQAYRQIESSDDEDSFQSTASTVVLDDSGELNDKSESGDEQIVDSEREVEAFSDAKVGEPNEKQDQDQDLEDLYNS